MKKFFERVKTSRTLSNILVVMVGVLFYIVCLRFEAVRQFFSSISGMLAPLVWGAIIAYLVNPIAVFFKDNVFKRMRNRRAAHTIGVIIAFLLSLALIALIVISIVPQVVSSAGMLFGNLEGYFDSLKSTLVRWSDAIPGLELDVDSLIGTWSETFTLVSDWVVNNIDGILGASYRVGTGFVEFLLALVFSIYILLDKDNILRTFRRASISLLKENTYARTHELCAKANHIFIGFLGGNVLDSLIIGVANFVFMLIFGMPYPLLITVIVEETNFIPTFGPFIGAIPSALIIFMINPWHALWFLIFTVALQLLDGNVIKPLLFGDSTGLRPLWVLASIIIGGRFFGLAGMILGIPVLALISGILEDCIARRLKERGFNAEGERLQHEDGSGE